MSKERVVIAVDSKHGRIVVKGWQESIDLAAEQVVRELEPFCAGFPGTYVDKEGMMLGTDLQPGSRAFAASPRTRSRLPAASLRWTTFALWTP